MWRNSVKTVLKLKQTVCAQEPSEKLTGWISASGKESSRSRDVQVSTQLSHKCDVWTRKVLFWFYCCLLWTVLTLQCTEVVTNKDSQYDTRSLTVRSAYVVNGIHFPSSKWAESRLRWRQQRWLIVESEMSNWPFISCIGVTCFFRHVPAPLGD